MLLRHDRRREGEELSIGSLVVLFGVGIVVEKTVEGAEGTAVGDEGSSKIGSG